MFLADTVDYMAPGCTRLGSKRVMRSILVAYVVSYTVHYTGNYLVDRTIKPPMAAGSP